MNAAKIKSAPSLIFELYYTSAETPKEDLEEVISILEKLQKKQNINFKLFENPNDKNNQILADEIRTAATRGKFKVVSGGGAALALSGSKKINYPHGPILVVRKDDRIVRVYPYGIQGIKGSKISAMSYLQKVLLDEKPIHEKIDQQSFTEQDLRNLIIARPSIIEPGLTFLDVEIEIDSAVIDLILIDVNNNHLLLEVKANAQDRTIGQILRYNKEHYAKKAGIKSDKIRRGIVTLSYTGQIADVCKNNNIELYILKFENIGADIKN